MGPLLLGTVQPTTNFWDEQASKQQQPERLQLQSSIPSL